MQASDPLDPRAVLGAVKAQPGDGGASRKPSATAGLDRPCVRRDRTPAGRDGGTSLGSNKGAARNEEQAMTYPYQQFPAEVCERTRQNGGSVFRARANTGDPNGPDRGLSANENARALISMMA